MSKLKQRKLQPKIERLFKSLELRYTKNQFDSGFDIRESGMVNSDIIIDFKYKNNVEVRVGIGCLVIEDNLSKYTYLTGFNNNKKFIECRLK